MGALPGTSVPFQSQSSPAECSVEEVIGHIGHMICMSTYHEFHEPFTFTLMHFSVGMFQITAT